MGLVIFASVFGFFVTWLMLGVTLPEESLNKIQIAVIAVLKFLWKLVWTPVWFVIGPVVRPIWKWCVRVDTKHPDTVEWVMSVGFFLVMWATITGTIYFMFNS